MFGHDRNCLTARLAGAALLVIGSGVATASTADFITKRRLHMAEMNGAMLNLGKQIADAHPNRAIISAAAAKIAGFAPAIPTWFRKGSGIESGFETEALPVIWQAPQDFTRRALDLQAAARRLQSLARSGDIAAVSAQAKVVDQACVRCHRDFRLPN